MASFLSETVQPQQNNVETTTKGVSFTGEKAMISTPRKKKDLIKDKLAHIEYADNHPCLPMVHFDASVWEGLRCASDQTVGEISRLQHHEGQTSQTLEALRRFSNHG